MTDRENMPPLPGPDFAAPTVYEYTADQLRAYGQACWNAAIEAAAKGADRHAAYAMQGDGLDDSYEMGLESASKRIASAIRSMKEPE